MNKYTTLTENLKGYSLLAGSIVASTFAAHSQIIYTDVDPDIEIGGVVPASYPELTIENIDMNNDGTFDFKFTLDIQAPIPGGYSFLEKIDGNFNPNNRINSYTIEYVPFALKNDAGDSIPLGGSFYANNLANFAFQSAGGNSYIWKNQFDRYVGIRFRDGVDDYYGWIRLDVNTHGTIPNIIIKSYAFQQTPGAKIACGDTGLGLPVNAQLLAEAEARIALFPNPSTGKVMIRLDQPLKGSLEVSLKDALGREVYSSHINMTPQQTELPFDFSDVTPGTYFVQLKSEEIFLTEKWVKN